jgi:hypothetical protein
VCTLQIIFTVTVLLYKQRQNYKTLSGITHVGLQAPRFLTVYACLLHSRHVGLGEAPQVQLVGRTQYYCHVNLHASPSCARAELTKTDKHGITDASWYMHDTCICTTPTRLPREWEFSSLVCIADITAVTCSSTSTHMFCTILTQEFLFLTDLLRIARRHTVEILLVSAAPQYQ